MIKSDHHTIYTIGHSTRTLEEFLQMLQQFDIELVADIRRFPGSRRNPQFSGDALAISLPESQIRYQHFEDLGGRRRADKDSANTVWRHPSFRGYADYMETAPFLKAYHALTAEARKQTTAIMCSEAVWWSCHRAMVADKLKADGWKVMHIMGLGTATEHPYTKPAQVTGGKLIYGPE